MRRRIELSGRRFSRLLVIGFADVAATYEQGIRDAKRENERLHLELAKNGVNIMSCNHQTDGSLSMVPLATSAAVPLLYLAELKLGNLLRRQLSPLRITPLQYITLTVIASRGTTSQEGLIEQMGVSDSDLTASIISLCDRGWLGREVVAGRCVTFCLTDLGRGLLTAASHMASTTVTSKSNLDEQEMEHLLRLLARIIVSPEIPCPSCERHKPILARTVREATENK